MLQLTGMNHTGIIKHYEVFIQAHDSTLPWKQAGPENRAELQQGLGKTLSSLPRSDWHRWSLEGSAA
jgi:hypothetical protein